MSNPMLTPHDKWQSFKCDCVYQNGTQIHGACENMCHIPSGYLAGRKEPNNSVPAIPLAVKYDYLGCVNIDDMSDPDDPIVVWLYDSWNNDNGETVAARLNVTLKL